jgi:hypothetical protein
MATNVKKTKAPRLNSGYFQTDINLLEAIATKTKSFNTLASYLAIARHGNGLDPDEPFRYSGSGLQSIQNYVKVGEITARNNLDTLLEHGFVHAVPKELVSKVKRYMLTHNELNLCLPFALINDTWSVSKTNVESALTRLQKKLTDDKTKLDALMILLNCYRADYFKMLDKGGLDPHITVFNEWVSRVIPKDNYQEWQLETGTYRAYPIFMRACLSYRIPSKQKELSESDKTDFWTAWDALIKHRLLYEAVTLFQDGQAVMTLRVNDYHADKPQEGIPDIADSIRMENGFPVPVRGSKGKAGKGADPSYMRTLNLTSGIKHQFYENRFTPNSFLVVGQAKIRVTLPRMSGSPTVIGVSRPRFRPSTDNVGQWNDRELANIEKYCDAIEQ